MPTHDVQTFRIALGQLHLLGDFHAALPVLRDGDMLKSHVEGGELVYEYIPRERTLLTDDQCAGDKLADSTAEFKVRVGPYLTEELERAYGSEGAPQGLQPWLALNRQNAWIWRAYAKWVNEQRTAFKKLGLTITQEIIVPLSNKVFVTRDAKAVGPKLKIVNP